MATEGKVPVDGIIFPSVQAGNEGVNVVLFQKASRADEMDIPKGTELERIRGGITRMVPSANIR